jgi:hypothetical protein
MEVAWNFPNNAPGNASVTILPASGDNSSVSLRWVLRGDLGRQFLLLRNGDQGSPSCAAFQAGPGRGPRISGDLEMSPAGEASPVRTFMTAQNASMTLTVVAGAPGSEGSGSPGLAECVPTAVTRTYSGSDGPSSRLSAVAIRVDVVAAAGLPDADIPDACLAS